MIAWVLGFVSLLLILGGVALVLRDSRNPKPPLIAKVPRERTAAPDATDRQTSPQSPAAAVLARSDATEIAAEVTAAAVPPATHDTTGTDVTIVRRGQPRTTPARPTTARPVRGDATGPAAASATLLGGESPAFEQLRTSIASISAEAMSEERDTAQEGQRWPSVESRWLTLEPDIDQVVARLNALLAPVGLQIGPAGEAGWSFKNRGFGSYRRVVIAGRSVAWLRGELNQTTPITFKVRAHNVEHALLNASGSVALDALSPLGLLEAMSKAMRPAAEYAAWQKPKAAADADAGSDAWSEVASVSMQALSLAGSALRDTGADLSETAPPGWDAATGRQRWPLGIRVGGNLVGIMYIDLVRRALEVAVTVTDRARGELGRRQRVDIDGMDAHKLAEAMATCAWPVVADALEKTSSSALGYAG